MTAGHARRAPFAAVRPCKHCPFRNDITPYLRPERAHDIADSLQRGDDFPCHATVEYADSQQGDASNAARCAGAMIICEKQDQPTQAMRIGERLGLYDRQALDMNAPVYDTFTDWVDAHHTTHDTKTSPR